MFNFNNIFESLADLEDANVNITRIGAGANIDKLIVANKTAAQIGLTNIIEVLYAETGVRKVPYTTACMKLTDEHYIGLSDIDDNILYLQIKSALLYRIHSIEYAIDEYYTNLQMQSLGKRDLKFRLAKVSPDNTEIENIIIKIINVLSDHLITISGVFITKNNGLMIFVTSQNEYIVMLSGLVNYYDQDEVFNKLSDKAEQLNEETKRILRSILPQFESLYVYFKYIGNNMLEYYVPQYNGQDNPLVKLNIIWDLVYGVSKFYGVTKLSDNEYQCVAHKSTSVVKGYAVYYEDNNRITVSVTY